jgi:hypothetical protein
MSLGSLPYATLDQDNSGYIDPSGGFTTVNLSNVQVGSTITFTGNWRGQYMNTSGDGYGDNVYHYFRMTTPRNGISNASAGYPFTISVGSSSILITTNTSGSESQSFTINFTASSSNVSITFQLYATIINSASLSYTQEGYFD